MLNFVVHKVTTGLWSVTFLRLSVPVCLSKANLMNLNPLGTDGKLILKLFLENETGGCGLDSSGLGQWEVEDCCEQGNKYLGFVKCGEFINWQNIFTSKWKILRRFSNEKISLLVLVLLLVLVAAVVVVVVVVIYSKNFINIVFNSRVANAYIL